MVQKSRHQTHERIEPALPLEDGEDLLAGDRREGHAARGQFPGQVLDQRAGHVLVAERLDQDRAFLLVQPALPLHSLQILLPIDERRGPAAASSPKCSM